MEFVKGLFEKEWVRLVGVLLLGGIVGALFYPTKRIEEKLTKTHQEEIQNLKEQHAKESLESNEKWTKIVNETKAKKEESELKVTKLTSEVKSLQSKQKTSYYKLIKPDGTIEIKKFTESEVNESSKVITSIQEEFKTKIESIETKWSSIHSERMLAVKKEFDSKESEYKKTIDQLTKSKTTSINESSSTIDVGMMTNKDYYGHATTTLRGPFIGSIHVDKKQEDQSKQQREETVAGIGLGMKF